MGFDPKALLRLIFPGAFLGIVLGLRPYIDQLSEEQLELLGYAPYLLGLLCVVLAYQFNRSRLLILAGLSCLCFYLVQTHLQVSLTDDAARNLYAAIGIAIPAQLLFLLLASERGVLNRYGISYIAVAAVLAVLAPSLVDLLVYLLRERPEWLQIWPREGLVLPLSIVTLYPLVAAVGLVCLCLRQADAEVAVLFTLTAGFFMLAWFQLPHISLCLFTAAGVVQLVSILRSSYAMAYRDDLTGLLGRRALNERLRGLGARYAIAMLDVDHFKKFNDTHGHDVGDEVLKMVASRIANVGGGGTAYRYGGEEFCIVFPRKDLEACKAPLEAVRNAIADYTMTLRDKGQRPEHSREGARKRRRMATRVSGSNVSVTISVGLAQRSDTHNDPEEVIKAADKMLYKAKQAGRNRLCY